MRKWKRLAIAAAIGAAASTPVFAGDGDALQSYENQHGNAVERNAVTTPQSEAIRTPSWNGRIGSTEDRALSQPYSSSSTLSSDATGSAVVSPSMSGAPSAAQESHATGKVDAEQAAPPRTGADVQPGDMGPSNAKAGGGGSSGGTQ